MVMVMHHHRSFYHLLRTGEAEQQDSSEPHHQLPNLIYNHYCGNKKKTKPRLLCFMLLFSLVSCCFLFAPRLFFDSSSYSSSSPSLFPFFCCFGTEEQELHTQNISNRENREPLCSSLTNNSICCDRTSFRTDICFMRGDVRTHSSSYSILLHSNKTTIKPLEEKIRPYTRKWEASVMDTIDELHLRSTNPHELTHHCDVLHDVPAVVFSTGGYTGNVYHEFNDGLLPLYITSHHLNKRVVFVILEYHNWWITKYADVLSRLSDYPPIDFFNDPRTHCFPEAIIGLRIHDELAIDVSQMKNNRTIRDFRQLLDAAYRPRIGSILQEEEQMSPQPNIPEKTQRPKLVIMSRSGSRAIENEGELVKLGKEIGFRVELLRPDRTTELAKIYRVLNSSDVMIGVHGAAMTHFLFMRPGMVFIQIVPLGTEWAAETYYGEPAVKMGLRYVGYRILPRESSLYREFKKDDPVLRDPESLNSKGWEVTKKVYLDGQNVRLDLGRFRKRLVQAHRYLVRKRRSDST